MGARGEFQPPQDTSSNIDAERKRFDALRNAQLTVDQLLELAERNPTYRPLLEKALVMATAGFGQPENRKKIAAWPDAIKSAWGVDAIATLNARVAKEGVGVLREFGGTKLTGSDIMQAVESVSFSFRSESPQHEQLQDAVLGPNWHADIENLLLAK